MRVLVVASEGLPFSKTGGLADVIEALPKALAELGHEVAVLLPCTRGVANQPVVLNNLKIPIGGSMRSPAIVGGLTISEASEGKASAAGVKSPTKKIRTDGNSSEAALESVRYFFVDDPEYFDREQIYGTSSGDYPDNAERFAEFSLAAIEFARLAWKPDVIHCHDWQSALVPVLLRTLYGSDPQLSSVPVVFTIHNMGYQGLFPADVLQRVGLPESLFSMNGLEFFGQINYLKGGVLFADYLTTVSRKYAEEIQTPEYGHGLDGVVRQRADHLIGILNGVDYAVWNPETDKLIAANYSAKNMEGKRACKKDLLTQIGLPAKDLGRPLIGIISRLAGQKGFDLLEEALGSILQEDVAMVTLGTGEPRYEKMFREWAKRFPAKLAVHIAYDDVLAHKIEAGADLFLMPSRYEPCGLNQIYSLRYGTVPVVRATGGLDDTIDAFEYETGIGTGFKFHEYAPEEMLAAVHEALSVYEHRNVWRRLQVNGMAKDFSWQSAATEYARLYTLARRVRIRYPAATSN